MAQYYPSKSKRSVSPEFSQQRGRGLADITSYEFLGESAIYIFPNPSSGPPSPGQSSDFSISTDFPFSSIDSEGVSGRRSRSHASSYAECSSLSDPSDPLNSASPSWEWTPDLRLESATEVQANMAQLASENISDQWSVLTRRQDRGIVKDVGHKKQRTLSDNILEQPEFSLCESGADRNTDHDKGRNNYDHDLPFLSLLVSLLFVDSSTANLLNSHSPQSFLFSGSNPDHESDRHITERPTHHLRRLVGSADAQAYKSLRDGLNAVAEYHSDTSPLLSASMGLCNIFTDLVADHVKSLRSLSYAQLPVD